MWQSVLPYREVKRGDIIVFRFPVHPSQHFVKRVVAVPGDRLRMHNKAVLVNGRAIEESYVLFKRTSHDRFRDDFPVLQDLVPSVDSRWWLQMRHLVQAGELVVPPGHYFVLGDNRDESLDSRYWGLVPRENIVGRPLLIYWSVEAPQVAGDGDSGVTRVAMAVTHFFQGARWDRTFRVVK
jgi:signal peptidase I